MTANQEIVTKTARETTPLEDFNKDWNVFAADFAKAEEEQIEYLRLYRQMSTKQAACVNNVKHLAHLSKQLRRDLRNLAAKDGEMDEEMKQRLAEKKKQLNQICTKIAEMDRELPVRDNGLYLSIILGSNLNISLLNPDERYRYKQEYESFKLSVTVVASLCAIQLCYNLIIIQYNSPSDPCNDSLGLISVIKDTKQGH